MNDPDRTFELFSHGGDSAYAMGFLAMAYLKSARLTCAVAVRKRDPYLAFPAIYLYRHTVELSLKSMIEAAREEAWFSRRTIDKRGKKDEGHDLKKLLARANELLPDDGKVPKEVADLVEVFDEIDPTSDTYRYTTKRLTGDGRVVVSDAFDRPTSLAMIRRLFNRRTTNALFYFIAALLEGAEAMADAMSGHENEAG